MTAWLLDDLMLSAAGVDRAAHLRADAGFHARAREEGRARCLWASEGQLATVDGRLLHVPIAEVPAGTELTFLGIDGHGSPWYLVRDRLDAVVEWTSLREIGAELVGADAGLAVMAVALDNWRNATRCCPGCGQRLVPEQAGWALRCPAEGTVVFPRTDPAVIVLVIGDDDRIALGRHANWPEGRFSTFAGFVEAGESAESAVLREVHEEAGLVLDRDRLAYLGSQPWPFPQSLMLGYHAWTSSTQFVLDQYEIVEARWFDRAGLRAAMAAGEVTLPPSLSISRRLIGRWLDA